MKKGSHVLIEGSLRVNTWEDKGEKHTRVEIVALNIIFLDAKPKDEQQTFEEPPATSRRKPK